MKKLLKQNDYLLLGEPNNDLIKKVKKRHSRAIPLLLACGVIYIKLGQLSSGKGDKFVCFRCTVQLKRGGKLIFIFFFKKSIFKFTSYKKKI